MAAVVVRHALDGRSIGLNLLGEPAAVPLSTAIEGAVPGVGANPFAWSAFAGRSRMVDAWQLVDSVHETRGDRMITIGVLDNGFWLDGKGVPMVPPGQPASDFSRAFIGFNLQAEGQPAGGAAPTGYAWHGNGTASTAAAVVNNALGAAGSGGTVATPVFFKTDMSIDQILRCVRICAWWGIDVLNMSFGIWGQSELAFPTGTGTGRFSPPSRTTWSWSRPRATSASNSRRTTCSAAGHPDAGGAGCRCARPRRQRLELVGLRLVGVAVGSGDVHPGRAGRRQSRRDDADRHVGRLGGRRGHDALRRRRAERGGDPG